jgi:hypothetical protein
MDLNDNLLLVEIHTKETSQFSCMHDNGYLF